MFYMNGVGTCNWLEIVSVKTDKSAILTNTEFMTTKRGTTSKFVQLYKQ